MSGCDGWPPPLAARTAIGSGRRIGSAASIRRHRHLSDYRRDELALEQLSAAAIMREVASVRITGSLPMSPVPLSVSMLQMAISSVAGTTNCRSTRESSGAWRRINTLARLMRGAVTRVAA